MGKEGLPQENRFYWCTGHHTVQSKGAIKEDACCYGMTLSWGVVSNITTPFAGTMELIKFV